VLNNEPLDLIDKEIDVALRVGSLPDSNLVARRLAVLRTQVYASQRYLERHGEPLHPDDLQHHRTLGMMKQRHNGFGFSWPLHDGTRSTEYRIDPVFVANDPAGLRGALLSGEGLMLANDIMMKPYAEAGYVRRVLPAWNGPEYELNAVFPRGRVQSPKVRAFVDFLVERLDFDAVFMQQAVCPGTSCSEVGKKPMEVAGNGYRLALRKVTDPKPESAEEEVVVAET
jgi:DNA-binding transcriptional LysR family regulator